MLRPLDPICWTVPAVLARARTVTKNNRPLTLRQALRVLANYGRRRTRLAVDGMRWKYVTKSTAAVIQHALTSRNLRRGLHAFEDVLDWVQGPGVQVERINRPILGITMSARISTTRPANRITVELGMLDNGRIQLVMYPLTRETHLRFLNANNERVDYPSTYPVMVKIELDAARRDHIATGIMIKDKTRISRGRQEHILHTACPPHGSPIKVTLRTLLNLGDTQEEPLTPA